MRLVRAMVSYQTLKRTPRPLAKLPGLPKLFQRTNWQLSTMQRAGYGWG